ncbi:MAG: diguanylate cyclase [Oscillospiraceae bacterium]|nr:diguanylate cyclase [Oscillospiraceae bacterium]
MHRIISTLLYAGLDKETFRSIKPIWLEDNRRSLLIYPPITVFIFLLLIYANLLTHDLTDSNQRYYITLVIINLIVIIASMTVAKRHPALVLPLDYLFIIALYWFALMITELHPDMPAVVMVALLLVAPFLFTDRPISMILLTIATVITLCLVSSWTKSPDVSRMDLWNGVSIGCGTIAVEIVQMRHEFFSYAQQQKVSYLSQTDILTGAKNRNHYENTLEKYPEKATGNIVVVYADVNGLHELNNTKGHLAGDAMLQTVASELITFFGTEDTYRVGGDEYIAITADAEEDVIRSAMEAICERLIARGYYLSFGTASEEKEKLNMSALVKKAEADMFIAKQEYYKKTGYTRRR